MKSKYSFIALASVLFSTASFAAQDITYMVDGKAYEGYWAKIKQEAPLVLLVHDWDGLTQYEKQRSLMLNDMGYNVFAIDLFGKDIRPTKITDKRQHTGELYTDRKKLQKLMNVSLAKAKDLGANINNMVLMGYCFGGAAVLEAARAGMPAKGYVTFHGGLSTPDNQNYAKTKAPILILHGTADTAIPMTEFALLANMLEEFKVPHEMITYSGAKHAFTLFDTDRYQKVADQKSWTAFSRFLQEHTKKANN